MSNAQLKEWHHLVSSHTDRTIFWQRYNDCETATRNSLGGVRYVIGREYVTIQA